MRSTFSGLELSKRSLFAQQAALTTTGHNIANANTKGYTRQVVNLVASRPIEMPGLMRSAVPGQMGQGVEFDYIKRIREGFLDDQYYNENKYYGDWNTRKSMLEKMEAIFNEPSDTGIRQVIEGFWNAWQVLSKEPENLTARAALKESAVALTDSFNHTNTQLVNLGRDLTESIGIKVKEINSLTSQVASLNNEIFRVEGLGNDANDLRDQRDLLVDQLSGIVNITVDETESGYNIKMGNVELVNGITVSTTVTSDSLKASMEAGDLNSGEVHGMFVSRDQYLKSYKFQVDSMIGSLVTGSVDVTLPNGTVIPEGMEFAGKTWTGSITNRTINHASGGLTGTVKGLNGLHALGYTLDTPPESGVPFFVTTDGSSTFNAGNVRVNQDILNKVASIAASSRVESDGSGGEKVIKGNNDIALALAGLSKKKFNFDPASDGTPLLTYGTFDEFYRAVVGQLGVQAQEANRQTTNQKILVDQVDSRRMSVSGVSLDEEMANMIKYQHAYNAAARAMTTYDEMLDKIINSMGVVGR